MEYKYLLTCVTTFQYVYTVNLSYECMNECLNACAVEVSGGAVFINECLSACAVEVSGGAVFINECLSACAVEVSGGALFIKVYLQLEHCHCKSLFVKKRCDIFTQDR